MIEVKATSVRESDKQRRYLLSDSLERFLRAKYLEQPVAPEFVPRVNAGPMVRPLANGRPAFRPFRSATRLVALSMALLVVGAFIFESQAKADQILGQVGYFVGQTAAEYSLNVAGAGTLSVNLIDYDWPSPLADLTLQIASSTQILGQMSGAGKDIVSLAGPGTYYAYVTGTATGAFGLGAYGLLADFQPETTPVPLPASISLLLGGIAATLWSLRRKVRSPRDHELVELSA